MDGVRAPSPAIGPILPAPRPTNGRLAERPTLPSGPADRIAVGQSADPPRPRPPGFPPSRPPFHWPVGTALVTSARASAAIAAGAHQIRTVDGRSLTYPSQDLTRIESARPDEPGQTHALARHVGTSLADNVARLRACPLLRAVGSYTTLADAQHATDETIANPANQRAIGAFLADPCRLKAALERVDLGRSVGTTTFHDDVAAGTPSLVPSSSATVVLIKDPTFPEGYRVLTTYPDTGRPEVDARGNRLA